MIRREEVSREEAIRLFNADKIDEKPSNYVEVLNHLEITNDDIDKAISYKPLFYENRTSRMNRLFAYIMNHN